VEHAVISFIVLGEPVPWARARSRGSQRWNSPRVEAQKALIAGAARIAGAKPLEDPMRLTVTAYLSSWRRVDGDNILKLVADALNGVAYVDDAQVMHATVMKIVSNEKPRTVVLVEPLAVWGELAFHFPPTSRSAPRLVPSVRRPGT
jgi:crossover junction endodeoxyribonuclease RusA